MSVLDGNDLSSTFFAVSIPAAGPDEIGAMTAFLASAKADFIQGSIIDVDGGATRSL